MSTVMMWQTKSTGSRGTERLGELLGKALLKSWSYASASSAGRKRGTDRAVQLGTARKYQSLQRSDAPEAAGAASSAGWQASGTEAEGTVVELCADLGGGKTTFVKGLAKGLGSKDTVASPTFTLKKVYKGREGVQLHHFDFYRLSEPGVVADQLKESLNDPEVVTVVEWSDSVKDVLPENRLCIEFQPVATDPDERTIHIHYAEQQIGIMSEVETNWQASTP